MRNLLLFFLIGATPFLSSCNDTAKEMDDLAKAQECLDNVPLGTPTAADACLQYVEKYTSQQANILKCSIYMTSGGLMEDKVVKAINALNNTAIQNKEAAYMSVLALDNPTTTGYDKAVTGNQFCQASGVPGLSYIGGLVVAGTLMAKTMANLGVPLDINNPDASVQNLINMCTTNPPDPACVTDVTTLGQTVSTLADLYCNSSSSQDNEVCTTMNSAVANAGSDPDDIGRAVYCFLENPSRNYDPVGDHCI